MLLDYGWLCTSFSPPFQDTHLHSPFYFCSQDEIRTRNPPNSCRDLYQLRYLTILLVLSELSTISLSLIVKPSVVRTGFEPV